MTENLINEEVEYATFWNRAGAYILDAFFLILITGVINFINISNYKSFILYLPFALIGICYKPFMESYYGATIGKMVLKLKVTNKNFEKIDITTSILRSLILIFPAVMYVPIYYMAFNNPNLADLNGLMEFSKALSAEYSMLGIIGNLSMILIIADIIFLLTDSTKTQRSLHDRIANTYVISDKKDKNTLGNNV